MTQNEEQKFQRLRDEMVATQLEGRGIADEDVLAVMRKVPRHLFVPPTALDESYADKPLHLAAGSTISQPYIVAYMLEHLLIEPSNVVLEIGTGSGYQTALLCELAKDVYSMDIDPQLITTANERLGEMGYRNFFLRAGDGMEGWSARAPFDRIIVAAACSEVPRSLVKQLAPDGRMIFPLDGDPQYLILLEKQGGSLVTQELCPVRFVPIRSKGSRGEAC